LAQPSPTAATWPARLGRAVVPVLRRAGGGAGSGRARAPIPCGRNYSILLQIKGIEYAAEFVHHTR